MKRLALNQLNQPLNHLMLLLMAAQQSDSCNQYLREVPWQNQHQVYATLQVHRPDFQRQIARSV